MKPFSMNFGGLPDKYCSWKNSRFAVVPYAVPSPGGSPGGEGNGPGAILAASSRMELFDEENKSEPYRAGIFVGPEIVGHGSGPQASVKEAERRVNAILRAGKVPVLLGGEHSGTLGAVASLRKRYGDLTVLQLDAHADLRDRYLGSSWNDSCVGRRILDAGAKLVQAGVRSISEEEDRFLRKSESVKTFYASEVRESLDAVTKGITSNLSGNVYITIDLDVFDPGIMPAVGTPEPGGLTWFEGIDILRDVFRADCQVVGFDVMELSPLPGIIAPDVLAARLCYRMMGFVMARQDET